VSCCNKRDKDTGVFVTIDGPNGVGKSSISSEIVSRLKERGAQVVATRQPSDTPLGEFIRGAENTFTGLALAALVVADRIFQVEQEIRPALSSGKIVVCDRYVASSLVLQRLDGVATSVIWKMNEAVLVPDLSVILSAPIELIEERMRQRTSLARFERVQDGARIETTYFADASSFLMSKGYAVVNVSTDGLSLSEVAEIILSHIPLST
jgi:dTMP kinase